MPGTLICWVGGTDLVALGVRKNPSPNKDPGLGPILQGVRHVGAERIVLLCTYPVEEGRKFRAVLQERTEASVELRQVVMKDPTDYRRIYKEADALLDELVSQNRASSTPQTLYVHLSPGTPAMQNVWVLLGMTRYPVQLIQSSQESGVKAADIPFDLDFRYVDDRTLKASDSSLEIQSAAVAPEGAKFGDIVYRGPAMSAVISRARLISKRSVPVLIRGETGTGKELLARAIHQEGRGARGGPVVVVNCGAIPKELVESTLFGYVKGSFSGALKDTKGAFQEADGGSLFLDELGEMPLDVQVKLLRAVQERKVTRVGEHVERAVDVRIIAATHRDLNQAVRDGAFREDLFYRLAVAVLDLPPLRERGGDLQHLVDALLEKTNQELARGEVGYVRKRLAPKARALLYEHDWPGNVRELESTLIRAAVWSAEPTLKEQDIHAALLNHGSQAGAGSGILERQLVEGFQLKHLHDEISIHYIRRALAETHHNKTRAATLLGLKSQQVLSNWMERVGIED